MAMGHVLIVDDEPGIRESLIGILEDEGYEARAVGSAEEALTTLALTPWVLVRVRPRIDLAILRPILRYTLPLAEIGAERLKRIFEINVYGAYLCAREAARRLAKDGGGHGGAIVNVSSAAARLGSPFEYVDYAGSKGAIDTLTIGLAKELGPQGVRVNAVRPGLIDTDIHASGGQPDRAARLGAGTALGRAGTAEEVAEAIVWLLSDAASYVTGALLDVSAGR